MKIGEILQSNLRRLLEGKKQLALSVEAKVSNKPVSQQYISRLATGNKANPSLEKLDAIATILKVPVSELIRSPNWNGKTFRDLTEEDLYIDDTHCKIHKAIQRYLETLDKEASKEFMVAVLYLCRKGGTP